eukprot:1021941-Pelagomonas_calceolata.AAC.7
MPDEQPHLECPKSATLLQYRRPTLAAIDSGRSASMMLAAFRSPASTEASIKTSPPRQSLTITKIQDVWMCAISFPLSIPALPNACVYFGGLDLFGVKCLCFIKQDEFST